MSESLNEILWFQFGAALQALENTIRECPPDVWASEGQEPNYWYIAYHTVFWTDYYASETPDKAQFRPLAPLTTSEFDNTGLPERMYSQAEVLGYLAHVRVKVKAFIASLDEEKLGQRFTVPRRDFTYLELTIYNMRHVQHHAAQLNLLLRQRTQTATGWVFRAREGLT